MRFSDKYGYTSPEKIFQREGVNPELRTNLWNVLKTQVWDNYNPDDYNYKAISEKIDNLVKRLWFNYFNKDMDTLPRFHDIYHSKGYYSHLKEYFFSCEWYELYNFLEEIAQDRSELLNQKQKEWINDILQKHNAAYRFVDNSVAEITSKQEIMAIEDAMKTECNPVRDHLSASLRMLSDKNHQDFRNSVKESISAVEAVCRNISGKKTATLSDALKHVENCHPALSQGFKSIYGYTSDESGIRHALSEDSEITYSDAKFMLVACSAFVSYLIESAKHT
jgi:hypothetical protein